VAVLTFNDPDRLNAMTEPMGQRLNQHVERLKDARGLRAVVLTGAGRAFSAGGDLAFLLARAADTPENNVPAMKAFYGLFLSLRTLPVPVLAAINGPAIGAGFCVALGGCDIRYASPKAKMGLTFTKLGLHPGMGATHFLPALVGPSKAAELLLTGRVISAAEAAACGLVSEVVDDPTAHALALARELATSCAPGAVRHCLKTLRSGQVQHRTLLVRSSKISLIVFHYDYNLGISPS